MLAVRSQLVDEKRLGRQSRSKGKGIYVRGGRPLPVPELTVKGEENETTQWQQRMVKGRKSRCEVMMVDGDGTRAQAWRRERKASERTNGSDGMARVG